MQEKIVYLKKRLKSLEVAMTMSLVMGCGFDTLDVEEPKVIDVSASDEDIDNTKNNILTYDEVRNFVLINGYSSSFVSISDNTHINNETLLKAYQLTTSIINKHNLSNKFLIDSVVTIAYLIDNGYEVFNGNDYITLSLGEENYSFRENWLLAEKKEDDKYISFEVDVLDDSYYMSLFMDLDNENSILLGTDNVKKTGEELVFQEDFFSTDDDEDYDKNYENITYGLTKTEIESLNNYLVNIYYNPLVFKNLLTDKNVSRVVLDRKQTFFELLNTDIFNNDVNTKRILRK